MKEDQFVPYELSVKLKELGFNENCLTKWGCSSYRLYDDYKICSNKDDIVISGDFVSAPLFQQAFDFLLKKYNLYGVIIPTVTMHWTFKTMTVVEGMVEVPPYNHVEGNDYPNIEEARIACLGKLIELIS